MRFFSVTILVSIVGFSSSSCSSHKLMSEIMSTWNGSHIDEVIYKWGYPDYEQDIVGRKLLHWRDVRNYKSSEPIYNSEGRVTGYKYDYSTWECTRTFEVDKNYIVIAWKSSGNNCPIFEILGYGWRKGE